MGVIDLTANSATYIGDVSPVPAARRRRRHRPVGLGHRRVRPLGLADRLQPDHQLRLARSSSTSATTSPTASTTRRPTSVILFLEGFKRPERFLALADRALELGKPIMVVKVGRSEQAQAAAIAHSGSLAGEARATDAALDAAGVIRCADLDELLETAELVEGIRRTGRGVGRGRTGRRDGRDRRGVAHRRPRAAGPASTCRRSPTPRASAILERLPTMGYIGNPLDPWGAADATTAYGAVFEAMAASGAYDVLVLVHDFPYQSMAAEVATADEVTRALLDATRDRPRAPAGLRVADVGRAAARDQGRAR